MDRKRWLVALASKIFDMTALDFFSWRYVKNYVYSTPPDTPENMKEIVTTAFISVIWLTINKLFEPRDALCIGKNIRHFEHLR